MLLISTNISCTNLLLNLLPIIIVINPIILILLIKSLIKFALYQEVKILWVDIKSIKLSKCINVLLSIVY